MESSANNMEFRRRNVGDCTSCPFSEPGKGDTSNPVYQNPPSKSDPDCFTKNTEALLSSLNVANPGAAGDINAQGCSALADLAEGDDIFHVLYYLDKTYCGLGQAHPTGDDPNINSILTNCSHYGISNLADPGWPSSSYQCSICPSTTEQSAQSTSTIDSTSAPTATQAETTSQGSSSALETTSSASLTAGSSSTIGTETPALASPTSTSDYSSASPEHQLPAQGIAAIVVCTTLAIAATLLLLLCVLRRRRKQLEAYSGGMSRRASRTTNDYLPQGGDTYEPLISASQSFSGERAPLTPPLRLNDRRLLTSLLRPLSRSDNLILGPPVETAEHGGSGLYSTIHSSPNAKHDRMSPQSPTRPTTGGSAGRTTSPFPSSPICAPTSNKMLPRLERMQTHISGSPEPRPSLSYTQLRSPPPVSFNFPPRMSLDTTSSSPPPPPIPAARKGHHRRGTTKQPFSSTSTSGSGGQDYHNAIINTIPGSSGSGSISPTRPRRPHEAPLEIPDLVTPRRNSPTPTSPPPNKSLPPPPPQPPPPPPMTIGIAKTTGLLHQQSREGSISLHSLARQHTRDRDSWGSWGDEDEGTTSPAAGRMFGVAFPPVDGSGGRV